MRAVVPPSVMPCLPAVPNMAPTMPLTMPLRISPAPRAASQPSTTLSQLVPLSVLADAYRESEPPCSVRTSLTLRGPEPPLSFERRSPYSESSLGASVLLSLRSLSLTQLLPSGSPCLNSRVVIQGPRSGPKDGRRAAHPTPPR